MQIGPGLGAEHLEVLVLTAGGPDHGADDGFPEALGQNRAPLRDQLRQMVAHDLHGGIPAVQGFHRVLHDGLNGVLPCRQRLLGHLGAAVGDLAVAVGGGGAGVCQIISRLLQEGVLLRSALVPDLPRSQGHAHANGGIRPRALGHHVRDGLHHLLIGSALHEPDLRGIDPPV